MGCGGGGKAVPPELLSQGGRAGGIASEEEEVPVLGMKGKRSLRLFQVGLEVLRGERDVLGVYHRILHGYGSTSVAGYTAA